ncbi:MAG: hypothetical protein LBI33_01035 [Propionibacteriaceae bacterium]|jgi:hypothetical protein|nr:hypothetical protein [Propionibacteriaceae bacterium]
MSWDLVWQTIMIVIGAVNLIIALVIFSRSTTWQRAEPGNAAYFTFLRVAGLIFVAVALYRSIFVTSYPDRLTWFDTPFNSPFVVRCLAVFAELSFIGMIAAVLLKTISQCTPAGTTRLSGIVTKLPLVAVGCIFLAQFFAFTGLITQYQTPFAIEESLWALAFISLTPVVIVGLRRRRLISKSGRAFLIIMAVWCAGYLAFQCLYALPFMYFANVAQDLGRTVPANALWQAIFGYTRTRDFDTWGGIGFIIWHSGYFSLCSVMTLFFMSAPRKRVG